MKTGIDTSVWVAAFCTSHPLHATAHRWLAAALKKGRPVVAQHSLWEIYAVLTRLPGAWRLTPAEAGRLIAENVLPHADVAATPAPATRAILGDLTALGIEGGAAYDGIIAAALRRAGAARVATFNRSHFARCAPDLDIVVPGEGPA